MAGKQWLTTPFTIFFVTQLWMFIVESTFFPSVMWTTTNELFSTKCCCPGETAGLFIKVPPSTKLYVVCPSEGIIFQKQQSNVPSDLLHDNCILVDDDGYNNCRYDRTKPPENNKIVQNCTHNPTGPLQFRRLVFDKISLSDNLVFFPGRNYTFISTSDGTKDSLTNNQGPGRCNDAKNNLAMKMKIYVCKESEDCSEPTYMNLCENKCASNSTRYCENVEKNWEYCKSRMKRCDTDKQDGCDGNLNTLGVKSERTESMPTNARILIIAGWSVAGVLLIILIIVISRSKGRQSGSDQDSRKPLQSADTAEDV